MWASVRTGRGRVLGDYGREGKTGDEFLRSEEGVPGTEDRNGRLTSPHRGVRRVGMGSLRTVATGRHGDVGRDRTKEKDSVEGE